MKNEIGKGNRSESRGEEQKKGKQIMKSEIGAVWKVEKEKKRNGRIKQHRKRKGRTEGNVIGKGIRSERRRTEKSKIEREKRYRRRL